MFQAAQERLRNGTYQSENLGGVRGYLEECMRTYGKLPDRRSLQSYEQQRAQEFGVVEAMQARINELQQRCNTQEAKYNDVISKGRTLLKAHTRAMAEFEKLQNAYDRMQISNDQARKDAADAGSADRGGVRFEGDSVSTVATAGDRTEERVEEEPGAADAGPPAEHTDA